MDYKDYQDGASQQHFWFKAKNKLVAHLLSQTITNNKSHILDIGAGTGDDLDVLNKFGFIHVIDINQKALDLIPTSLAIEKKCCSASELSYEDNSFDAIVAFDVLEHIPNDQKAVNEIMRVLKPGGFFIFTVPAYQWLFSAHDSYLHHVRRYNKNDIQELLQKFTKITLGSWLFFLFPLAAISRLLSKNKPHNEHEKTPNKFINSLMYGILQGELWLIKKGLKFPWGLTIYGIYQKPSQSTNKQGTL